MRRAETCLVLVAAVCACALAASCGNVSSRESVDLPTGFDTDAASDAASPQSPSVGPEGGTFEAGGELVVVVPPGAVQEKTLLMMRPVEDVPPGYIGTAWEISLEKGTLAAPITLQLKFPASQLPWNFKYPGLRLGWLEDGRWKVLVAGEADEALQLVSGAVDHLSVWAVIPQVEVDMLLVVDNSVSMCGEHRGLADNFGQLRDNLLGLAPNLDLRVAATTTDSTGDNGVFNTQLAPEYPPGCFEARPWPCLGDQDCSSLGPEWECKSFPADQMYNMNGSVNSTCLFRCQNAADCCMEFCTGMFAGTCGDDPSCLEQACSTSPALPCDYDCELAGGSDNSGCLRLPATSDCPPEGVGPVLAIDVLQGMDTTKQFNCIVTVAPEQSYQANMEQGLKAAWLALDPNGPNAQQSASFLRDEAFLVLVFVSDEDDCSIDPEYASPNYTCLSDEDCLPGTKCKVDVYYSKLMGKTMKLCHGIIKKDYYNTCSLLAEFKGKEHHECAYDLSCSDCETDGECDYGWECKQGTKCRPAIFGLSNIASYQQPPGSPVFSLRPVAGFYSDVLSLKKEPSQVFVAAFVGDGLVEPPTSNPDVEDKDLPSLLSNECLENAKLKKCALFKGMSGNAPAGCAGDPASPGCEDFLGAKLDCIRDCYVASKGDISSPAVAKNTYVCQSEGQGKADLGRRYIRLAEMFGPRGVEVNICSPDSFALGLVQLGTLIGTAAFE